MNVENYNDHKSFYYKNDNLCSEHYYLNDEYHRIDGPAYIYYHENGNIEEEQYFLNDKLHRTDGAAYIIYDKNGNIDRNFYYLNGEEIFVYSLKDFKKYQKTLMLR